jgi:hypothetical protein
VIDFSVYKCFRKSMAQAFSEFRSAAREAAGVEIISGKHQHHEPPWTFEKIVRAFLHVTQLDPQTVEYDHTGLGTHWRDQRLRENFKAFHDALATIKTLTHEEHYAEHYE